jgi:hypothetical protein
MEASACSCDYDLDPVKVMREHWRKARKEHRCQECQETIAKGTVYWTCGFYSDGHWERLKRCKACYQIGEDYCCGVLGEGMVQEAVWELLGVDLVTGEVSDDCPEMEW